MAWQVKPGRPPEGDDRAIPRWTWELFQCQGCGASVYECKIDFGPGYRVYFGKDREQIVILLGGGTKQRQQNDISLTLGRWEDYKKRKTQQKEEE
jgi:putative addiction module killer protein